MLGHPLRVADLLKTGAELRGLAFEGWEAGDGHDFVRLRGVDSQHFGEFHFQSHKLFDLLIELIATVTDLVLYVKIDVPDVLTETSV